MVWSKAEGWQKARRNSREWSRVGPRHGLVVGAGHGRTFSPADPGGASLCLRLAQGWQHDAPRKGVLPYRHTEPATGEPEGLQGAAGGGTREIEGRWLWVRLASQPVVRLLR